VASPTPALIRAQVAAVRDKVENARVIGISVPTKYDAGDSLVLGGEHLDVTYSDSVLAIRESLAAQEVDGPSLVLLTPLAEMELGADIVARLARKHLFAIAPWQLVKQRFQARWVDPRLVEHHPWVATKLLESEPEGGYPPAPSGFVEADVAWRFLFASMLGLPGGRRDPVSLLEWASDADQSQVLVSLDGSERVDLANAVEDSAGELSKRIFDCAGGEHGASALSIGLVARVLFGPEAEGDVEAAKAAVRLEHYLGGSPLEPAIALGWADAAETVIQRRIAVAGIASIRSLLDDADDLLREKLLASERAYGSAVLQLGYEQRFARFAAELLAVVEGDATELPQSLWEAADQARTHVLALHDAPRCERMQMAIRLANWLVGRRASAAGDVGSFGEAATAYRQDEGFADWARAEVWDGDPLPALAAAYSGLSAAAGEERERGNQRFGSLFANWSATGSHDDSVIPVEDVLERVARPLAKERPILVAVIDGMGMPVFRELERDLSERGWVQLGADGSISSPPVISAVPSVTEVSRTSLLSGKLTSGNQKDEANAFPKHPGLLAVSSPSKPPRLFHKGQLTEPGKVGLAPSVAEALTDPKQHVVGLVINAVDDHLAKGEQVRVRWGVDAIRPLDSVLSAALEAGRIVILVSDHGHIPEHQTEKLSGGEAERWRHADTAPNDPRPSELLIEGPRVVLGQGGKVIAPWSERIRFSLKKNGYHGGLSPQEVVIPLGVFSAGGAVPEGWAEIPRELPAWWERTLPVIEPAEVATPLGPPPSRKKPKKADRQRDLFDAAEEMAVEASLTSPATAGWVEALLASETMESQRKQAARTALSDERIRAVLQALDERGGKLTRAALATQLAVPAMRVNGILSALRRILNLEGYSVLSIDEASDTIELNREMLSVQFGLQERAKT